MLKLKRSALILEIGDRPSVLISLFSAMHLLIFLISFLSTSKNQSSSANKRFAGFKSVACAASPLPSSKKNAFSSAFDMIVARLSFGDISRR